MIHPETYVVDLNDVYENEYLIISRRHTLEYGRGVLVDPLDTVPVSEGDNVLVFSGDEDVVMYADVIKDLHGDRYAVRPAWDTVRPAQPVLSFTVNATDLFGGDPQSRGVELLR